MAVPHSVMDWSKVCNCGTSWSYSLTFYGPFHQSGTYYIIEQKKDQARLHICTVSPEPLKIALKRWNVDEGSAKFYRPVKESLPLMACASSEGSGEIAHLHSLARAFANHTKKKRCMND